MGEGTRPFFEASFNRSIKVQGGDDRLTSDGGAMLLGLAERRMGIADRLAAEITDRRDPMRVDGLT